MIITPRPTLKNSKALIGLCFAVFLQIPLQPPAQAELPASLGSPSSINLETSAKADRIAHARPLRVQASRGSLSGAQSNNLRDTALATKLTNAPAGWNASLSSTLGRVEGNMFRWNHTPVEGNYRLSKAAILKAAGLDSHPYFWSVTPDDIRERLSRLPWVEKVDVAVTAYPASVRISIEEADPWLIAEYERHSWLVSRSGRLLQPLDTIHDSNLILETTELARLDGLNVQSNLESYLSSENARLISAVRSIRLLQSASKYPFEVERYSLLPNGSIKIMPAEKGAPEVLISAKSFEEADISLRRLGNVLEDLRARNERPRRIDLRFQNQAVVE